MTNSEITQYLIDSSGIGPESKTAFAAGYFEAIVLDMMGRSPKFRKEMIDRVSFRQRNGFNPK